MESVIGNLTALMFISFAIERVVEFFFAVDPLERLNESCKKKKIPVKRMACIVLSVVVAFSNKMDFVSLFMSNSNPNTLGYFLTGMMISGGGNLVSSLMTTITSYQKNTQTKET